MKLTYKELHKLIDKNIDIFVKTPTGNAKIINKFKKISDGYIIKYDDNTETRCATSHNMRFNSGLKGATEIKIGDVDDWSHKKVISKEYIKDQEFYDFEIENQDGLYIQNGIIHHNSGKSLVISILIEYFRQHNLKGILLVPNINLLTQFKADIKSYNLMELYDSIEIHGDGNKSNFEKPLTISTWQSMMESKDKLNFDYVICDECLHPDTKITTINGNKSIKDIKKDDLVLSFNEITKEYEYKPVVEVHKNLSKNEKVYDVELENGKVLTITGNHKVLTQRGWVRADKLTVEDDILEIPNDLENIK